MTNSVNLGSVFNEWQQDGGDDLFLADPAEYRLEVISCKARTTDVMPVYKITAGPYAGRKVMAGVFSWNGNAKGIFFRSMKGFGLDADFFKQGPTAEEVAKALVGRVADVTLGQKEWQGEMRNEIPIGAIKFVSAPAGSGQVGSTPVIPAAAPAAAAVPAPAPAAVTPPPAPAPAAPAPAPAPAAVEAPAPPAVEAPPAAVVEAPPAAPPAAPPVAPAPVVVEDPGF